MTRSQLVVGVLMIAVGVLLLLDRYGGVDAWASFEVGWPAVLLLAGAAQVLTRPRNLVGGVVLTALGVALLSWTLGLVTSLALPWPLLLIALGIWLMAARRPSTYRIEGLEGSDTDIVAVFDDRVVQRSGPFVGGSVTAVFADVRLDLEVPEGWRVTVSGPELLGDVHLRTATEPPVDAPVLQLRVVTILGDVDIHPLPAATSVA